MAKEMPKDGNLDHTLSLLKEGYYFIINRQESLSTNIFETNLLGEKAYCLIGSKGAKLFYDNELFRRSDAAPKRVEKTLFGKGGVQGLDGQEHYDRKSMFMGLMDKNAMQKIRSLVYKYWSKYFNDKLVPDQVKMYGAAKQIFLQTACEWTGVPLKENEVNKRASQLANLFESPAAIGLKHWKGRISRSNANKWIEKIVQDVRLGNLNVDDNRALYQFTWHRDTNNELLETSVVAVEILNLLRPMTAVSVWVANTGLGMHQFPETAKQLKNGDDKDIEMFLQEIRRYYPFFPFAVARVKKDFEYEGFEFQKDTLTLLDLYGTNRYPNDWSNPKEFVPERFEKWEQTPFNFIPQGGGSYDFGHRCAGEFVTMAMMKATIGYLMTEITYDVPEQNFSFNFNNIPAIPSDGFIINNVQFYKS